MNIRSPYGKDALEELRNVYGLEGFDALEGLVNAALERHYALHSRVLEVHVAYGLTVALEIDQGRHYLKFWSSRDQPDLPTVFAFLDALEQRGVPAPRVVRTVDGAHSLNLLPRTAYDSAYLMRRAVGAPAQSFSTPRLTALARTLAAWHSVGAEFAHGASVDFALEMRAGLPETLEALRDQPTASAAGAWLETRLSALPDLPRVRTHGDFRLCHVFFQGDAVSGVIDADTSIVRTRLADVAQAVVTHPDPARCALLEVNEIQTVLGAYNQFLPPNSDERAALPVIVVYTALEQWAQSDHRDDERAAALVTALFEHFDR